MTPGRGKPSNRELERQERAAFAKRSAAAKKGWETRRKNEKARRRKQAARKPKRQRATTKPGRRKGQKPKPPRRVRKPKEVEPTVPLLPAGTELEMSVRYDPKKRGKKQLYLKIRMTLLRPMTREQAFDAVEKSVRRGIVQDGIDLAWIDWQQGDGWNMKGGEYMDEAAHDALVAFHSVIMASPRRRIAVVREGDLD